MVFWCAFSLFRNIQSKGGTLPYSQLAEDDKENYTNL